ncbi:hypothetical protein EJB05_03358, partial [Eragrostis curvula]
MQKSWPARCKARKRANPRVTSRHSRHFARVIFSPPPRPSPFSPSRSHSRRSPALPLLLPPLSPLSIPNSDRPSSGAGEDSPLSLLLSSILRGFGWLEGKEARSRGCLLVPVDLCCLLLLESLW